jgi:hypothetical protein
MVEEELVLSETLSLLISAFSLGDLYHGDSCSYC